MDAFLIGLGSNLGDRLSELQQARTFISLFGNVISVSPIFETEPVGPGTANYLNAALALACNLHPTELLDAFKNWERDRGRPIPKIRWADRPIDLDILDWSGGTLQNERLNIPHPEVHRRRFVLFPLLSIAPDWIHPVLNIKGSELLAQSPEIHIARTNLKW